MPPADASDDLRPSIGLASALMVAGALLLVPLDHGDLTKDGPMYAFVPLRSLASGEYVRLYRDWAGDLPYFNKPPLQFWLTSGVYALFGAGVATARLVAALTWLACVATLFLLVRPRLGTLAATLAAALLPVQREVFNNVLEGRLDGGMLLAFLLASLAALRLVEDGPRLGWWLLLGGAIGFGVTYRGPYSLAGLGVVLLFLLWQAPRLLRDWRGLLAMFAALIVAGGWWWAVQYALYGDEFANALALDAGGKHLRRSRSIWDFLNPYYLKRIPEAYAFALVGAIAAVFVLRRDGLSPIARLSIVWIAFTLVLIQLTPVRGGRYTLPFAPWLCVLAAIGATGFAGSRSFFRKIAPFAGVATLLVVGGLSLGGVDLADSQDGAIRAVADRMRGEVAVADDTGWPAASPRAYLLGSETSSDHQKLCAIRFWTRAYTRKIRPDELSSLPANDYLFVFNGADRVATAERNALLELLVSDGRWHIYKVRE